MANELKLLQEKGVNYATGIYVHLFHSYKGEEGGTIYPRFLKGGMTSYHFKRMRSYTNDKDSRVAEFNVFIFSCLQQDMNSYEKLLFDILDHVTYRIGGFAPRKREIYKLPNNWTMEEFEDFRLMIEHYLYCCFYATEIKDFTAKDREILPKYIATSFTEDPFLARIPHILEPLDNLAIRLEWYTYISGIINQDLYKPLKKGLYELIKQHVYPAINSFSKISKREFHKNLQVDPLSVPNRLIQIIRTEKRFAEPAHPTVLKNTKNLKYKMEEVMPLLLNWLKETNVKLFLAAHENGGMSHNAKHWNKAVDELDIFTTKMRKLCNDCNPTEGLEDFEWLQTLEELEEYTLDTDETLYDKDDVVNLLQTIKQTVEDTRRKV